MKKKSIKHDFDFHISEYLYYCQSRRLRRKTIRAVSYSRKCARRRAGRIRRRNRFVQEFIGLALPFSGGALALAYIVAAVT